MRELLSSTAREAPGMADQPILAARRSPNSGSGKRLVRGGWRRPKRGEPQQADGNGNNSERLSPGEKCGLFGGFSSVRCGLPLGVCHEVRPHSMRMARSAVILTRYVHRVRSASRRTLPSAPPECGPSRTPGEQPRSAISGSTASYQFLVSISISWVHIRPCLSQCFVTFSRITVSAIP